MDLQLLPSALLLGFKIRDAHGTTQDVAGIYMYYACECKISDNIVTNISATGYYYAYGIRLYYSSGNSFHTTTVYNLDANLSSANSNANGICLSSSSDNSFHTTTVYNLSSANYRAYGIGLWHSSNNTFSSSTTVYNLSANYYALGILLYYSSDNSFDASTVYNLSANQDAYGIRLYYSSDKNSFVTTTVYNLSSANHAYGISLSSSSDNSFISGSISDINAPTWWDFYSDPSSQGNSAKDITISSIATTISFTYENGIMIKSVQTPPADPADKLNIWKGSITELIGRKCQGQMVLILRRTMFMRT
jgi:hypothetical protein